MAHEAWIELLSRLILSTNLIYKALLISLECYFSFKKHTRKYKHVKKWDKCEELDKLKENSQFGDLKKQAISTFSYLNDGRETLSLDKKAPLCSGLL